MNKLVVVFLLLAQISLSTYSTSTDTLKVYLLTYTPGEELYSTFGHSSLRILNLKSGTDQVYNYGTFNFKTKNFYMKFLKGKLNYYLSMTNTRNVLRATTREGRSIVQNELLISPKEKQILVGALKRNYLPENRDYRYDFFYDNCATRIFWLIDSVTNERFVSDLEYSNPKFHKLVNEYLYKHPLAMLGFNIFAGKLVLKKTDIEESLFLPDYLKYYLNSLSSNEKRLLGQDQLLVYNERPWTTKPNILNWIMATLLFLGITIRIIEHFKGMYLHLWDKLIFIPAAVIALLILCLWIISEHQIYSWNMNLIWTLPALLSLFVKYKEKSWFRITSLTLFISSLFMIVIFLGIYIPFICLILILISRLRLKASN